MACYNEQGAQALLILEQQALRWRARVATDDEIQLHLNEQIISLNAQIASYERELEFGRTRMAELTAQLMSEIEQKNNWRARAESPVIWPYLLGGGLALVAIGAIVGAVISAL